MADQTSDQPALHRTQTATTGTPAIAGRRRLAAVLAADVVGYSRLMQLDEDDTHARMMKLRTEAIAPRVAMHAGTIVKHTGDGFIAMFDNAQDAVDCAVRLQRDLLARAAEEPTPRQINFRIGINVSDVIVEGADIFGDGVNIAARLQTYAEPGGIVVSDVVAGQIGGIDGLVATDLGDLPLRNLTRPVRALSLRIDDSATSRPLGDSLPGLEVRPSIVVMPFTDVAANSEDRYFAEGIVDDIIHGLAGLKELFVISRGSTLGYQGQTLDIRAIARELHVRYVLHGSVRRERDRLRIRTELCDTDTGAILYVEHHDGALSDLFDLQHRIATRVVKTIAPNVRERERARAMRKHPQNMTAYDFVLQALGPLFHMDHKGFALARGLLQQAINHDPDYAPAYSYMAYWHLLRVGQGWSSDVASDTAEAARTAAAAIDRDETDALALAIYGHVHSYLLRDFEAAVDLQDRAIEVGPNCAMAWTLSSVTRGYLNQGPTAVLRAEQGLQLSPRGPHVVYYEHILSQAHYINGNYDEAVRWGNRAARHNERLTSNLRSLAASLTAIGQLDEARDVVRRLVSYDPMSSLTAFARNTPLQGAVRDTFVERLKAAGFPE